MNLTRLAVTLHANYEANVTGLKHITGFYTAVVVVVLALIVWLVLRQLARRQQRKAPAKLSGEAELAADRVEALPFLRQRSHDDLLGQARRHYEQGNYSEAIVYLFSHELVELDRSSLIRLASLVA